MLYRNIRMTIFSLLVLLLLAVSGVGCNQAKTDAFIPPPYIPAQYYKCIEASATDLIDRYFPNYDAVALVETQYNGEIFVFKDNEITKDDIEDIKSGYLWVDMIRCSIQNTAYAGTLKPGDRVDVVGVNKGLTMEFRGLVFSDCVVLPAGSVQLPSSGSGGGFTPGY